MSVVIGVDGGATKTASVALVVAYASDAAMEALGEGLSTSSNKNSVGKEKAEAAVADAVDQALAKVGPHSRVCLFLCSRRMHR